MNKLMTSLTVLFVAMISANSFADEVTKTNINVLEAESVEVVEKECMFALRKTMTEKEAASKSKYSCYALKIKNAIVETEDGEQMILGEVETSPLVELFNTKASLECAERIATSMEKKLKGMRLGSGEKVEFPHFEVIGVNGSSVKVATAKNVVFGSRTLGRDSFSYKNTREDYQCHPHADKPSIQVVEHFEEEVVEDEDVLGQLGRHAKGFGWNLLRAGEKAVDYTADKLGATVSK